MIKFVKFLVLVLKLSVLAPLTVIAQEAYDKTNRFIEISNVNDIDIQSIKNMNVNIRVSSIEPDNLSLEKLVLLRDSAKSIHIEVDDICYNDCSLLLVPISDKLTIKNNGAIILTSSVTSLRVHELGRSLDLNRGFKRSIKLQDFNKAEENYADMAAVNSKAINLLISSKRSPHHLYNHSIALEGFRRRFSGICGNKFLIGIVLDEKYLRNEFYNVDWEYSANLSKYDFAAKYEATFGENFIALNPFTFDINESFTSPSQLGKRSCLSIARNPL